MRVPQRVYSLLTRIRFTLFWAWMVSEANDHDLIAAEITYIGTSEKDQEG